MKINPVHNISFGTNVSKTAKKELAARYPLKHRTIIRDFENDGFTNFTLEHAYKIKVNYPADPFVINIPLVIFNSSKGAHDIAQSVRKFAIDEYMKKTGEYPINESGK